MQSNVAWKREVVAQSTPSPTPTRVSARRPAVWDRIRAWAGQPFTAEKREEVGGIIFILLVFFLAPPTEGVLARGSRQWRGCEKALHAVVQSFFRA